MFGSYSLENAKAAKNTRSLRETRGRLFLLGVGGRGLCEVCGGLLGVRDLRGEPRPMKVLKRAVGGL